MPLPRETESRNVVVGRLILDGNHLAAAVGPAVATGAVWELHFAATRADRAWGLLQRVMRASSIAPCAGRSSLGIRHMKPLAGSNCLCRSPSAATETGCFRGSGVRRLQAVLEAFKAGPT